jgi:hypothetical protein
MIWVMGSKNGSALSISSLVVGPLIRVEQEVNKIRKRYKNDDDVFYNVFLWKVREDGTLILDATNMIDLRMRKPNYNPVSTPHV